MLVMKRIILCMYAMYVMYSQHRTCCRDQDAMPAQEVASPTGRAAIRMSNNDSRLCNSLGLCNKVHTASSGVFSSGLPSPPIPL
ncbi:hypothetical protein DUNSADRAFT_5918 [Dunaliella salina]|uniref:Secreted protein n=1 Tax=Dunaliella salina TaxID=3046 RepID=A0ABQ7GPF2_DUNSA|nr:hypothetical protein DUNSADRAFT_5918 [Dunaliella salina]|eukprot:KAF5836471.1 hypothetical protein DUNSADRAFT_5918 [Dunaliella salina]